MTSRTESLARRVQVDPDFFAFALADYARSEDLNDSALASQLGVDAQQLTRLRLCLKPRPDPGHFQADIDRIASAFGVPDDLLLAIVRRSDALAALRDAEDEAGILMAARDREDGADIGNDTEEDAP